MGCCCSLPEKVEVNGQGLIWATVVYLMKEFADSEQQERNKWQGQTGPRVKMSQGSRWVSVIYPLKESK